MSGPRSSGAAGRGGADRPTCSHRCCSGWEHAEGLGLDSWGAGRCQRSRGSFRPWFLSGLHSPALGETCRAGGGGGELAVPGAEAPCPRAHGLSACGGLASPSGDALSPLFWATAWTLINLLGAPARGWAAPRPQTQPGLCAAPPPAGRASSSFPVAAGVGTSLDVHGGSSSHLWGDIPVVSSVTVWL